MKPRQLMVGDTVFFRCTNPDTGRIKRMAKSRKWADVDWSQNKTSRVELRHLVLLCPVLNAYLVKRGDANWSIGLQLDDPDMPLNGPTDSTSVKK